MVVLGERKATARPLETADLRELLGLS